MEFFYDFMYVVLFELVILFVVIFVLFCRGCFVLNVFIVVSRFLYAMKIIFGVVVGIFVVFCGIFLFGMFGYLRILFVILLFFMSVKVMVYC